MALVGRQPRAHSSCCYHDFLITLSEHAHKARAIRHGAHGQVEATRHRGAGQRMGRQKASQWPLLRCHGHSLSTVSSSSVSGHSVPLPSTYTRPPVESMHSLLSSGGHALLGEGTYMDGPGLGHLRSTPSSVTGSGHVISLTHRMSPARVGALCADISRAASVLVCR